MPELDLEEFLSAKDIGAEANVRIADKGHKSIIRQGEGKDDIPTFEIGVIIPSGEKRIWTMNKTSQRALATAWGKNSDTWVNKVATLFTTDMNVRGTMKKVIYARVPAAAPAPSAQSDKWGTCGDCDFMDEPADSDHCGKCMHNQMTKGSFDNFIQR